MSVSRNTIVFTAILLGVASVAPAQRRGWGGGGERGDRGDRSSNATSQPTTAPADAYAIVVDRNIFLRDRRPPVVINNRQPSSRPFVPPPTLEASLVLRGVVLEEGNFHAYFENNQSNEIVRVGAGDPLAKGRVADISIDAIEFETPGGVAWIKIGDNLTGARVADAPPSTDGSAASSSSSTQATGASTTNPALLSIEERMRQRRMTRAGGR